MMLLALQGHDPDIVLLDTSLPRYAEVLKAALEGVPARQTILLAPPLPAERQVELLRAGCCELLGKPLDRDELRSAVAKASASCAAFRQNQSDCVQFAALVAHELKSPLDAVEGYLQMLQDGVGVDDPGMIQGVFDRCLRRTRQMRRMVTDLGEVSRLDALGIRPARQELDLRNIAKTVIETFAPSAANQQVSIELQAGAPALVFANPEEMETVLNNLVSNAVKYNRPGGRVEVMIQPNSHMIHIGVSDTGIGMTSQDRGRIFRDFARIRNAQTRKIHGTGLGLSIVRRIVEGYGGTVSVDSQPDRGSTFMVQLPRSAAASS